MTRIKKYLLAILSVIILSLTIPVLLPSLNNISTVEAATIKINKKTATLEKGKTLQLKITGTKMKIRWSTSKKSIASVSSKGCKKIYRQERLYRWRSNNRRNFLSHKGYAAH